MSRKRVQLSDLDRKKICELAVEHESLSQDKLTALLQTQLNKPALARSTVTGILKERTKWLALSNEAAGSKVRHRSAQWENLEKALTDQELLAFVSENPADSDSRRNLLRRLSKPHHCKMQGSSSKAWQCSWLTILNFQLKMKCYCKCWQPKCQK